MKNYICLLWLLCSSVAFCQNDTKVVKPKLEFKLNVRVQSLYPIQFGNTALTKAHQPRIGFSSQFNVFDYQHFKAGFGFDFVTYDITNKQVVANLIASKYTSIYALISYEYAINKKFMVTSNIGFGSATLDLGSRNSRFGGQDGKEFRIGAIVDYRIGLATYVFGGVNYITNTFDIETAPEYESFFSKANQLQLSLGIRFGN